MKYVLGSLVLVLATAACGAGEPRAGAKNPPASASASASAPARLDARQRWAAARQHINDVGTGHFVSEVRLDGLGVPLSKQSGEFDVSSGTFKLDATIRTAAGVEVATAEVTADGKGYLQMRDWGTWSGCWLAVDQSMFGEANGSASAPVPVSALLAVDVAGADQPGPDYRAEVDAMLGLRLLGFSPSDLESARKGVRHARVPVTITFYDDRETVMAKISGADALSALDGIEVPFSDSFRKQMSKLETTLTVNPISQPVTVTQPSAGELLPPHAGKNDTCPANR